MNQKHGNVVTTIVFYLFSTACGANGFSSKPPQYKPSNSSATSTVQPTSTIPTPTIPTSTTDGGDITIPIVLPPGIAKICSDQISVSGKASPWLALAPDGTALVYSDFPATTTDRAPAQSPILHSSNCIVSGKKLIFETSSTASLDVVEFIQKGEGRIDMIRSFALGATRGLSDIKAPLDSLIAVFVPASLDANQSPPEKLDFGTQLSRDFDEMKPKLQQVFFIGDGKKSDGTAQKFVVPEGASGILFGNMDVREWNNNSGSHKVQVNESGL